MVEQSSERLQAQRAVPMVRPALTHRASRLPLSREALPRAPTTLPPSAGCPEPGHVLHALTFSPLAQVPTDSVKAGQRRPEPAKMRGRGDPTLPHPRTGKQK